MYRKDDGDIEGSPRGIEESEESGACHELSEYAEVAYGLALVAA